MAKQMSEVNCSRGAPMGRRSRPINTPCRLFQVRLDSGGCDDGGAYWGVATTDAERLWCARDDDGDEQFIRAPDRSTAAHYLMLDSDQLKNSRGVSQLVRVTFRNGDAEHSKVLPSHETASFKALPWLTILSEVPLELGEEF